jgi:23S rRNA (cytidine1920-2'-O)/16S rRNA (cytidine1409-2'-O)-methyltransferase
MNKLRLDHVLAQRGLTATRSQAESYIKLGYVKVNGRVINKPGFLVDEQSKIQLTIKEQYVSRAALKLASVAKQLNLDFKDKTVLDVGSSTGGFTDYALRAGAKKIIAVDVGADQMHPSLLGNPKIELQERTDIRDVQTLNSRVDIALIDVSFISLREVLPHISKLITYDSIIAAMVKPQFEAHQQSQDKSAEYKHKGVIKNDAIRRKILKDFEDWAKKYFKIIDKADSTVAGSKGNLEKFYLLRRLQKRF